MARLPVDIAELSNRNEMPTGAMQTQEASARNFGGLQAQALGGLGDAVSGLAMKIEANRRQSAGFDAEQRFIQLQEEDARAYEERKRGLAGSGDGFWESARADTNKRYDEFVESLPKWAQEEYRVKAERQKAQRSNVAFSDQYVQQDNNSRAVLSEEDRKAGLGVQANPGDFEAFKQRQHDLIDKSTLPAAEKEERKREIDSALAVTAAESDAVNNPGGALSASSEPQGDWLKYSNQGATRNDPLDSRLVSAMSFVKDMGITMDVISGGQESNKPGEGTGSTRHNHGNSADVDFYKDGRKLDWNNPADLPVLQEIVRKAKSNGVTGIGAGDDYMGTGRFHVGFGSAAVWGAGGKSENAPAWLVEAYNGVPAGTLPSAEEAAVYAAQPAYMQYLTPDQKSAYYRTAERAFQGEMEAAQAIADAQRNAAQDAALLGIMEGPDPEGAYQKGRQEGLFGSSEEVKRADAALAARQEKDADATRGLDLLNGTVPGDRNSASDKKAVNGAYNTAVNAGVDPADAARSFFDKTNIVPPDYARGLIAGAAARDPATVEQAFIGAANILGSDPNAFNGVPNSSKLVEDAFEFQRRTEVLGQSSADAAAAILADRARPPASAAVQDEALKTFRKDVLTPEAVEAGLAVAAENGWGADGRIPVGAETGGDAMRAIYRGLAEEGFRKFGDPDRAMSYAAKEVERRFGVYNGTLIQYPPDKAGLPKLPKADDPYAWVAEQAAMVAGEALGIDVPLGQVVLVPIEERGVSTRAGFNGMGVPIPAKRDPSSPVGMRGASTGKTSVPYSVVVVPDDGSPAMLVPGVFLPDINEYVKTKNAQPAAPVALSIGQVAQPGAAAPMQSPDEAQAEADARLREAQEAERQRGSLEDRLRNSDLGLTPGAAPTDYTDDIPDM